MKEKRGDAYILDLIKEGEHQQQDFKFEISDVCKIAKTLSAFANTDGGRLLIGVKDNGKIAGVRSDEEQYMIQAAAKLYCVPSVNYEMTTYIVEGKQVLLADIKRSVKRPVCAKTDDGKLLAYIRVADENILATPVHLKLWQQDGSERGELTEFTEKEKRLLEVLASHGAVHLNKCCRLTGLSRFTTINLLAKFIRYGVIEAVYHDQKFLFTLSFEH
ncbi:MAG: ATP-binding protein [Bacteroidaceae bacterium]|nr:ATP-binding protein [Bacteroidaceae bacterium]